MRRWLAAFTFLLVGLAGTAPFWGEPGEARKNGVSGRTEAGCTCHGGGTADAMIAPALEGVPNDYEPGRTYTLTAHVAGGPPYLKAGFNLNASSGTLSVPEGEANVQITTPETFGATAGEATHKTPDSRSWQVAWTAPPAGAGTVTFRLATNSVNGNDQPDALDKWNRVQKTSDERNLPPRPLVLNAPDQTPTGDALVSWVEPAEGDVVRVEIHKGTRPGFPLSTATRAATVDERGARSANISNLAPDVTYYFRARVVDQGDLTADSNEVSLAVVAAQPAAPTIPDAQPSPHDAPGSLGPLPLLAAPAAVILWRRRPGGRNTKTETNDASLE